MRQGLAGLAMGLVIGSVIAGGAALAVGPSSGPATATEDVLAQYQAGTRESTRTAHIPAPSAEASHAADPIQTRMRATDRHANTVREHQYDVWHESLEAPMHAEERASYSEPAPLQQAPQEPMVPMYDAAPQDRQQPSDGMMHANVDPSEHDRDGHGGH